ncbi:MAG: segregation/condensation protein A [Gemmataceae bacterium]
MSYAVELETFHGPLDLLLHLVKKNEVDVLDIPIATVTEQFLAYLQLMQELDLDLAGEFVVMAATLMEIKSRMLLPHEEHEEEEEGDDPRRELVKQLLEYRRFKDAAAALEACSERQGERLPRHDVLETATKTDPQVKPVELWDLVSAFARLVRETQALQTNTIAVDDTPQFVHEERILNRLAEEGRIPFAAAFDPPYWKARLIGIFLAILELIRNRGVGVEQGEEKSEIWLVKPNPAPLEPAAQAME